MSALSDDIKKVIRGDVETDPAVLEKYSRDASLFVERPEIVVHPKDAQDVCALVEFVAERKKVPKTHLSLTARAAGTDMSGGPLTDSIVVDTTKYFNKII